MEVDATTIEAAIQRSTPVGGTGWLDRHTRFLFILPAIFYALLLGVFPLIFSLYLVFHSWQPGSGGITFIGLNNLKNLLTDIRFWRSLQVTFLYVVLAVGVEVVFGFVVALALQVSFKTRDFFRTAFALPMLLTPIAIAFTWKMMFDFNRGPINYFLAVAGLPQPSWLGQPTTALISLIIVDIWQWTPFVALTLLAALESQDVELYDAALVDGASTLHLLRFITLPLLAPYMIAVVLLRAVDAFKVFDTIFVLTGGGPGSATEAVTLYAYVAHFRTFNMGYMSTLAWGLLIIMSIIFTIFLITVRRVERES
jgi:multiple sugar transport system permease protein